MFFVRQVNSLLSTCNNFSNGLGGVYAGRGLNDIKHVAHIAVSSSLYKAPPGCEKRCVLL